MSDAIAVIDRLHATILDRRGADPEESHTARLFAKGRDKIAQKLGEEAVEAVIEAIKGDREALIAESADVVYHLLVLWADCGVSPDEVWEKLAEREGRSGVAEKKSRPVAL